MNVVLDGAGTTLSEGRVVEAYRKLGYSVDRLEDIRPIAVPALAADVVAVSTAATRAATHYAMSYGFRVESPPERALAWSVLSGATSPDLGAKQVALAEVARVAKTVVQKKTWEELEKRALVRAIRQAAKTLTNR
jgi:hypothetical protein